MVDLTANAISATSRAVGRPALNLTSTTVRLPLAVLKRIDALLGENRRAEFIREAVERELKRRERDMAQRSPKA